MDRHPKRGVRKNAAKEPETETRVPWRFVLIAITGSALLAISSNLRSHRHAERSPPEPHSASSDALAKEVTGAPLGPENSSTTNDTESDNIDRAAQYQNRGTDLLAQGKIDQAVAQYQEAVRLNPADEDSHYNLAL